MMKKSMFTLLAFLIALPLFTLPALAVGSEQSYVVAADGEKQNIPLVYNVVKTYAYFDLDKDVLSAPSDIYIDDKDRLYILDAGNSRVIKLDAKGNIIQEYLFTGDDALNEPNGIFVDKKEVMYIADTENGRVIAFDKNGKRVLELVQPDSHLYDENYPFRPIKVEVDELDQVYILNRHDYQGFIIMDKQNDFKNYLGSSRLSPSFMDSIIDRFASESQKEKLGRRIPPVHTNFTIDDEGTIYTTTGNTSTQQLKRYSAVGSNFYPKTDSFGDDSVDYIMTKFGKTMTELQFVDVCVDKNGIITLLENLSGRIYQYDKDGVMLCVFGGTGNWEGKFMNPVAIGNDSQGHIYVLDKNLGTVQIFEPTNFIQVVHSALGLYGNAKYVDAQDLWKEILLADGSYPVAHIGMGKAELKQNDYSMAMYHYKLAGDKNGYSTAFSNYMKGVVQQYFIIIVVGITTFVLLAVWTIGKLREKAKRIGDGR